MRNIKFRYTWKRKIDGHLYQTITPIECLEGNGDTPFLGNDEWDMIARDQFTGFTDGGKSDLYENDVIENDGNGYFIQFCEEGVWDCINIINGENIALAELASSRETWFQGDLHTNPELLKTKQ